MQKTILYILVLAVLGVGVWFFLFRDNSVFGEDQAGFTVTDTTAIGKVFLASQKGDTISLQRKDGQWQVNTQYKASPRMVENLLLTLQQQSAAYPVPEGMHNNVVKSLAGDGVKVEIFDRKGKTMKVFYVGGQAGPNKGTFMLIEGAERPYVVQLQAYQGYVTPRYSTNITDWRDRTLVEMPAAQLTSVSVEYAGEGEELNSFKLLKNEQGKFDIVLHPELKISAPLNEKRVNGYATFFSKIGCEGFMDGVSHLDSIIASVPKYCHISVKGQGGTGNEITLYRMRVNKRSKNVSEDYAPEFDNDRMYGVVNNARDTVIVQYEIFDKLLRKGYEFYEAETTPE